MEVSDVHIGKQLQVNYSPQGVAPVPCAAYLTGSAAIPGTGYFNGSVLVGSSALFPLHTASLQVTRPDPVTNPLAFKAPSIVHIRGLPPPASTPIDVIVGDPAGPVGMTMATTIVLEINTVSKKTLSPLEIDIIALMKKLGVKIDTGAKAETGAKSFAGAEARAGAKAHAGVTVTAGSNVTAANSTALVVTDAGGNVLAAKKNFDIKHPNKEGWRLRHACVEGPEAAVYIRGRLKENNVIELPEYWKGLINYDTISVNLTPFGRKDDLYVKDIQEDRIIVAGNHLSNVNCFYQVWADRLGEFVVEYEGESPADYPIDQSDHSVAGYHYDVRN
jgi:hypothetical protein